MEEPKRISRGSRLPEFYKRSVEERLEAVSEIRKLGAESIEALRRGGGLSIEGANAAIENVVSTISYPLGIATNFRINDRDVLVPMATEEPSVIAAASKAAKDARPGGGFHSKAGAVWWGTGEIHLDRIADVAEAQKRLTEHQGELIEECREIMRKNSRTTVSRGGDVRGIEATALKTREGEKLLVKVFVDTVDSMGANTINTILEGIGPRIAEITSGRLLLPIVSNLDDFKIVTASVRIGRDVAGGEEMVDKIVSAAASAEADPYRAATHNKGILNGVIAVATATMQDARAIEAGAHAHAAMQFRNIANDGYKPSRYTTLSTWSRDENGDLVGTLEMPMPVARIGGATRHPVAQACFEIMDVHTAPELAEIMGAVGLAQNYAALRAIAYEGIQKGHMRLAKRGH